MNRFNDPWNRALDGADSPQDGMQRPDIERLLEPGAHDILKLPTLTELHVIADCRDQEVLIERGGSESVLVKKSEINGLIAMLVKAKDLFNECEGK